MRILLAILLILLSSLAPGFAAAEKMTVSFIDVGQGDSTLVQLPDGRNMLIDAGDPDHGQAVVSYLRSLKIGRIDILVASHRHTDHIGGMPAVLSAFKVAKMWDSGYSDGSEVQNQFLRDIKNRRIFHGTPRSGFSEKAGAARIDILAPVRMLSGTERDANNNSLVIRVSYGQISFLFAGDMETEEIATITSFPQSTALKVAHHGSQNGMNARFLSVVSPRIAVISVAARNDYHYPHSATLTALENANAAVYTTSANGTVVIITDGNGYSVDTRKSTSVTPDVVAPGAPGVSDSRQYIGNVKSKVFHLPSCVALPHPNNRVYFRSRDEAVSRGYRKHGGCVR